jgi:hypothetical protein
MSPYVAVWILHYYSLICLPDRETSHTFNVFLCFHVFGTNLGDLTRTTVSASLQQVSIEGREARL